jgi:DNA-binding MarR family transcriptional regulator
LASKATNDARPAARPGASADPEEPWQALRDAFVAVKRRNGRTLRSFDLSNAEYIVLGLCAREPARASEIAEAVGITPAGATDLIDRMEGERLLRREPCPDDRRVVLVHLTNRGEELYRKARHAVLADLTRIHAALEANEREGLRTGLKAFRRAMEADEPTE